MLFFTLLAAVLWLHELWLKGSGWRYERHPWASSEGRPGEASNWEETPGRTQDTLERFRLLSHRGTPQRPRRARGRGKRCERMRWDAPPWARLGRAGVWRGAGLIGYDRCFTATAPWAAPIYCGNTVKYSSTTGFTEEHEEELCLLWTHQNRKLMTSMSCCNPESWLQKAWNVPDAQTWRVCGLFEGSVDCDVLLTEADSNSYGHRTQPWCQRDPALIGEWHFLLFLVSEHATVMLMWAWQPHTAVVDFPLCAGTLFQSSYDEFINMCVSETDECNVLSEWGVTLKMCPVVICDHTNSSGEFVWCTFMVSAALLYLSNRTAEMFTVSHPVTYEWDY